MNLIIVSFEDLRNDPQGVRCDATPSAGLAASWLDALIGVGTVFSRDYAAPDAVSTVGVEFPTSFHADQFCLTVRKVANLLGTRAHVHKVPSSQVQSTLREAARHRPLPPADPRRLPIWRT